jgi:peptidoglycan/LPS O-acetylase OafA/YrhL
MADPLPHRPVWIFDYVVDPLLALILIPWAGLWPPRVGRRHRLTPLLIVQAAVFGALGLLLLLLPDTAAAYWPWALPPVLGQLYACFILTFAIGAALAARETSDRAIRDFLLASLGLAVLALGVSALHIDRFKPEPVTTVWFSAFGVAAIAFAVAILVRTRATPLARSAEGLAQP